MTNGIRTKERPPKGRDRRKPTLESVQTTVSKDINSLRELVNDIDANSKESRENESSEFKQYTLIAALSTFYAMAAIFFFTEHDIFDVIIQSHSVESNMFQLKSQIYFSAALIEILAVFICATGVLTIRWKKPGKNIKWSMAHVVVSISVGIGPLPFLATFLSLFGSTL